MFFANGESSVGKNHSEDREFVSKRAGRFEIDRMISAGLRLLFANSDTNLGSNHSVKDRECVLRRAGCSEMDGITAAGSSCFSPAVMAV